MSGIEVQEVNNITVDVFKNDIEKYITLWMEERNIEDMCKTSQNRWYNCCNINNLFIIITQVNVQF